MKYRFEELEIRTPGRLVGACGQMDPIEVEWDINAGGFPFCLTHGIEAIRVESTTYVGRNPETGAPIHDTEQVDIMEMHATEAEFITYLVAREIAHRIDYDKQWMRDMQDAYDDERRRENETAALNAADLRRKLWLVG